MKLLTGFTTMQWLCPEFVSERMRGSDCNIKYRSTSAAISPQIPHYHDY